jgi:hypothetical protein
LNKIKLIWIGDLKNECILKEYILIYTSNEWRKKKAK